MSNRILYSPGRIVFIQLILIIGFCVLIARLVYLQIYQDVFLADQVFERLDSNYSLLATRGKILDRNNKILALDVKGFSVGVDLSKFTNSQNQIDYLSKVIKKEPSLKARDSQTSAAFTWRLLVWWIDKVIAHLCVFVETCEATLCA